MKNIITIFAATILTTAAMATTTPEVIVTDTEIEIVDAVSESLFLEASFNAENKNLSFQTKSDISFVQIINEEGVMEFQLPVDSNNVQINKNLFNEGNYKLGFIFKGKTDPHFTTVQIK